MKRFWFNFVLLSLLIIAMTITSVDPEALPYSLLFSALVFALFFLLSTRKTPLLLYIGISAAVGIHQVLIVETYNMFSVFLLVFLAITAAYNLNTRHLYIYLSVNLILTVLISVDADTMRVGAIIFTLFMYFLIVVINQMIMERKEVGEIYDKLSSEYRQLKRLNLRTEEAARIEERTKIARDIHDSVGHRLTALIMKLEMLDIQNPDVVFHDLKKMANDSLSETREAVKALKTEEYEGISTVVHLIRKLEAESHILVQFTMKQGVLSLTLSNEKSVVLYRTIQEALTNAMRHAQAREVHIVLGKTANGNISFEISNRQFEEKDYKLGFGLRNMNERVLQVNGKLDVYQTEKKFVVSGTIPSEERL
ncbi:sensor histidine kinase [Virgibacillus flavescens]|uniref:sensor histidine kinase n=1 Tax=Virgibacillus flavescens TaxID=1611422 RepID=UPI003D3428DA